MHTPPSCDSCKLSFSRTGHAQYSGSWLTNDTYQGWIQDFLKGGANDGKGEWGVPPPTKAEKLLPLLFVTK